MRTRPIRVVLLAIIALMLLSGCELLPMLPNSAPGA
jgi:hypothetical protein